MLDKPSLRLRFLIGRFFVFVGMLFLLAMVAVLFFAKIDEKVYAQGYVSPRCREEVRAHTAGVLVSVFLRDGDHVRRGDVMAALDDTQVRRRLARERENLARLEANLAAARRRLEKLRIDTLPEKLRFVQLDLKQAELQAKLAESEWRTSLKLVKDGVVSDREVEKLRTRYEIAANEMTMAEQKVKLVEAGLPKAILEEAEADASAAQRAVESSAGECRRLEEEADRHLLRAPAAGWIILAPKRPGESVVPGELVFTVQTSGELELRVFVPEDRVLKVEPGQRALIYSSMFASDKYGLAEGRVRTVASTAEEINGKRSYLVRIDIESSPLPLKVGSTAEARILVRKRTILDMLLDSAA